MFERGASSLVVGDEGSADKIGTKTDVPEVLTWIDKARSPVQVFMMGLLDDTAYDEVSDMIDTVARRYGDSALDSATRHNPVDQQPNRSTDEDDRK